MKENRIMTMTGNEEFVVAKAIGKEIADNTSYWTLFDIKYREKLIVAMKMRIKKTRMNDKTILGYNITRELLRKLNKR